MRLPTTALLALLASAAPAAAYWKGFNVGANNPDGSCKTQSDWATAFARLQQLPGHFTVVRTFATSDCDTLANAVPAALAAGTQLLVGVWTQDDAHFGREKAALEAAIRTHGDGWIAAILVGNEDLYRQETTADVLAGKIYDVRGMVRAMGVQQEVGHADTWTAWVDGANEAVIRASDFVAHQGYPYWQGADVAQAADVFWSSVQATRDVVNAVKPGTWVWMTETGWPVTGDDFGASHPSVENAQAYWKAVACDAFNQGHVFWYSYQDYTSTPSFGVFGQDGNALYDTSC